MPEQADVVVYAAPGVELTLPLDPARETVWASQAQIVELFGVDVSGVSRHIRNVFKDGEVDQESNLQKVRNSRSDGPTTLYSLDVILAVGYRTNSSRAIEFRKWASSVLKTYLIEGIATNEKRLDQIGALVQVMSRSTDELVSGVAEVLSRYLPGLRLLREYDEGDIATVPGAAPAWGLTIDEAREVIARVGAEFPSDTMFGRERGEHLESVIHTLYAGFGGQDLYPTVEEKAANLLYLVVKDHPLSDGNKRSAAALFVTFLARNGILYNEDGHPKVTNHELAAVTLMVAMSEPREKDLMIALITRMLE